MLKRIARCAKEGKMVLAFEVSTPSVDLKPSLHFMFRNPKP